MARRKIEVPEIEVSERDFVLARVAIARAFIRAADDALDEFAGLCASPEDDKKGESRAETLEEALNQLGSATRSLECAEGALPAVDMSEIEPWEDEE